MTAERDRMTVMGMMTLANEGTSLLTTSGLLGGSPRFQHLSFSAFLSLPQGKARQILLSLDITMGKLVYIRHFQSSKLPPGQQPSTTFGFSLHHSEASLRYCNQLVDDAPSNAFQGEIICRAGYAILTCFSNIMHVAW